MEPKDALKNLELKFTSSNKISVERAVITRKEWESIYKMVNIVVPALKEAAEFLGHLGFRNEAVEQALKAIGAEPTTDKPQNHASDERRGG